MSKELVISANRHETKVAILEDDQLVEVFFQRANEYSLAGSIHKGRVTRVLPGMQSAFVDLGLERDTFLYVSDFFEENEDFDRVPVRREGGSQERGGRPQQETRPSSQAPEPPAATGVEAVPGAEAREGGAPPDGGGQERFDGGDRGDRRGRRSRRRRNRGRGFPDAKYASGPTARGESPATPAAPVQAASAEPVVNAAGFSVLPGESLAKYRGGAAEESELEAAPAALPEIEDEEAEVTAEVEAAVEAAESELESDDEEISAAVLATVVPAAEAEESGPAVLASNEEALEGEPTLEAEAAADAEDEAELDAVQAAAEKLLAGESATPEAAPGEERAEGGRPPQLTAQLREQGGRYAHRMPRRMRRKTRGGFGDSRQEGPPSAEPGASRPEPQRTVSRPEKAPMPSISELLKEGQEIIVQIAKEPLGQKGARITSHIALPGRFVVYMPTVEHTGVSRKIASDEERQRLKRILQTHTSGMPGGFIVRTAGEGKSEEDLAADMNFLFNLWLDIRQKAEKSPAPVLLHHDLDIVQRTLRDQLTEEFKAIWVDNEEMYESVVRFVQRFQPLLVSRIKLYTRSEPIFDAFNITAELEKALRPKVWLKSGGYIVINQTEALVAIDINTGKYVGRSNRLEDTIVKTNTEAVKEIVRQIRLRDLGGIIVVDFIDMDERKNRQKVMQALEEAMRADRAPYKILQFNDFGLVAITRKRVKQSLERALCMPCPYCEGAGYVKSVQTIVGEILQEAHKIASAIEGKEVVLRAHPDVAKFLKSSHNKYLEELEEILHRPVLVRSDPQLHHEKFDLG